MRRPKSPHTPAPARGSAIAANVHEDAFMARLGCQRMHERTEALFVRMAIRDGTDLTTAMIRAQHGAAAAMRWAA